MPTSTMGVEEAELLQKVWTAIRGLGYTKLRKLQCNCKCRTITLGGVTDCYYMKQLAYSAASKVPGVESVIDEIEVAYQ
jgi:osmotically-inducible protein OsmY